METLFLRLTAHNDKPAALAQAVAAVNAASSGDASVVFPVDPQSFRQVPGSPFCYWVSEHIRKLFTELPPFEGEGRKAQHGLSTKNDFRFIRAWWEVSPNKTVVGTPQTPPEQFYRQTYEGRYWIPFAKGGAYSPFYADLHLVVSWKNNGEEIEKYLLEKYPYLGGNANWVLHRECNYFHPGLTWPLRTQLGFNMRFIPSGAIFGHKGPTAFLDNSPFVFLGLCNSRIFRFLVSLQMSFGSYEVGVIQRTCVCRMTLFEYQRLQDKAIAAFGIKRRLDTADETSHVFQRPALLQVAGESPAERLSAWQTRVDDTDRRLAEIQREIDDIAFKLYGISDEDRAAIEQSAGGGVSEAADEVEDDEDENGREEEAGGPAAAPFVKDVVAYAVGCVLGRWDIRFATGEKPLPDLPDPFAPLPAYSPGMLAGDVPADYPLRIDADGILVDDPNHPDDIVGRVRQVIELVWGERAEATERELCELLGVADLRDFLRSPKGFFDFHVKRYSKSRRKAPIYWLLQSSRKNYGLWLYYHRLDKDTLSKVLVNYVEPKIRLEESGLEHLRNQRPEAGTQGREAKRLEKQIERREALVSEVNDFRDKLRRAADLHLEPDLNDGVVLNIAPLWELVPWPEAKKYWRELSEGKHEWSSIARQLKVSPSA